MVAGRGGDGLGAMVADIVPAGPDLRRHGEQVAGANARSTAEADEPCLGGDAVTIPASTGVTNILSPPANSRLLPIRAGGDVMEDRAGFSNLTERDLAAE